MSCSVFNFSVLWPYGHIFVEPKRAYWTQLCSTTFPVPAHRNPLFLLLRPRSWDRPWLLLFCHTSNPFANLAGPFSKYPQIQSLFSVFKSSLRFTSLSWFVKIDFDLGSLFLPFPLCVVLQRGQITSPLCSGLFRGSPFYPSEHFSPGTVPKAPPSPFPLWARLQCFLTDLRPPFTHSDLRAFEYAFFLPPHQPLDTFLIFE